MPTVHVQLLLINALLANLDISYINLQPELPNSVSKFLILIYFLMLNGQMLLMHQLLKEELNLKPAILDFQQFKEFV